MVASPENLVYVVGLIVSILCTEEHPIRIDLFDVEVILYGFF